MSASSRWPRSRSFCVTPRCPYAWMPRRRSQSKPGLIEEADRAMRLAPADFAMRLAPADRAARLALPDRGRRGDIGSPPGRERFQLLERPPDHVHGARERHAEIAFPLLAESGAGREEDAGRLEDARDEVHGALPFGRPPPDEESAAGRADGASERAQSVERGVAPLAIDGAQRGAVRRQSGEPPRGRDLGRLRRPRIDVRLEPYERVDERRS